MIEGKPVSDGRVTVDVYNIVGERVRRIADFRGTGGLPFSYSWDGLSDRSEVVGNGVYVILARGPDGVHLAKVIVLK